MPPKRKKRPDPMLLLVHAFITGFLAALPMLASRFQKYDVLFMAAALMLSPVQGALRSWMGEPAIEPPSTAP